MNNTITHASPSHAELGFTALAFFLVGVTTTSGSPCHIAKDVPNPYKPSNFR